VASARYYTWDRLGRPLEPAQPIREIVERLKSAFPRAVNLFGWGANEAHYQADPPQDHTPYSADGWPVPDPPWVVCATDVMHRTDLGVDCNVLFPYWLREARAGRMPWLKYLIYQATIYDVRHGWQPQANSGHFDHVHLSTRTDHLDTHLGSWSLVPGGDDMPLTTADAKLVAGATLGSLLGSSGPTVAVALQSGYGQILALVAEAAADKTRDAAVLAAVQALATAGGVDSAPIVAAIQAAAEASRTQVAALQAEVAHLQAQLAAALHAGADALDT
jgi:hypothetical protein